MRSESDLKPWVWKATLLEPLCYTCGRSPTYTLYVNSELNPQKPNDQIVVVCWAVHVFAVFGGRNIRPVISWKFWGVLAAISLARIGMGAATARARQGRVGSSACSKRVERGRKAREQKDKPARNSAPKP